MAINVPPGKDRISTSKPLSDSSHTRRRLLKNLTSVNSAKSIQEEQTNRSALKEFLELTGGKGLILTFLKKGNPILSSLKNIVSRSLGLSSVSSMKDFWNEVEFIEFILKNLKWENRPILLLLDEKVEDESWNKICIQLIDQIRKNTLKDRSNEKVDLDTKIYIVYISYELNKQKIGYLTELGVNKALLLPISEDKIIENLAWVVKPEIVQEFDMLKNQIQQRIDAWNLSGAINACNVLKEKKEDTSIVPMFMGDIYLKLWDLSSDENFCHTVDDIFQMRIEKKLYEQIIKLKRILKEKGIDLKDFLLSKGYTEEDLSVIKDFRVGYIVNVLNKVGFSNKLLRFIRFTDEDIQWMTHYYFKTSEHFYLQAINLNLFYIEYWKKLANLYKKTNQEKKLLKTLWKLYELNPLELGRDVFYIKKLLQNWEFEQAFKVLNTVLNKVLKDRPKISKKKYKLAIALQFLKCWRLQWVQSSKGQCFELWKQELEKLLPRKEKFIKPEDFRLFYEYAEFDRELGNYDAAISSYMKALKLKELKDKSKEMGKNIWNLYILVWIWYCYSKLESYKKALVFYEKALELDRDHIDLNLNIFLTHFYLWNYEEAIKWIDRVEILLRRNGKTLIEVVDDKLACFISAVYLKSWREDALPLSKQFLDACLHLNPGNVQALGAKEKYFFPW